MKKRSLGVLLLIGTMTTLLLTGCTNRNYGEQVTDQLLGYFEGYAEHLRNSLADAYAQGLPLTDDLLREKRPEMVIPDLTQATPEFLASSDAVSGGAALYAVIVKGKAGTASIYSYAGGTLNGFDSYEAHLFACADITVTYEAKPRSTITNGTCPEGIKASRLHQQYSLIDAATGKVLERPVYPFLPTPTNSPTVK